MGETLGAGVGSCVGSAEGCGEGTGVGTLVGASVGTGLGSELGAGVGTWLGCCVGSCEGCSEGAGLGTWVGWGEGRNVGKGVGACDGPCVGSNVARSSVGRAVGPCVGMSWQRTVKAKSPSSAAVAPSTTIKKVPALGSVKVRKLHAKSALWLATMTAPASAGQRSNTRTYVSMVVPAPHVVAVRIKGPSDATSKKLASPDGLPTTLPSWPAFDAR